MQKDEQSIADQIFISYARPEHIDAARILRTELQQRKLNVFLDEESIRSGDQWITRLEAALQSCRVFVVLIGQTRIERWVGAEVQIALARHYSRRVASVDESDGTLVEPARRDSTPSALPMIVPVLMKGIAPEVLPPFLSLFQATPWPELHAVPPALIDVISKETQALSKMRAWPKEKCPYQGLAAFEFDHANLFFGRKRETLEALAKFGDQNQKNPQTMQSVSGLNYIRWLQIEGASGAGKSSLVKAGMLPAIESGSLWARTGFSHWKILGPMTPGQDPVENLAAAYEHAFPPLGPRDRNALAVKLRPTNSVFAAKLKDRLQEIKAAQPKDLPQEERTAILLVVDQFEELYTYADKDARRAFEALLVYALRDEQCPFFMITTMRSDFTHRIEEASIDLRTLYTDLNRCAHYKLLSMDLQGLDDAISIPAYLADLNVDKVKAVLLADAQNETGSLPLVENALTEMWRDARKRKSNEFSDEFYRRSGGLAGLLAKRADTFLASIDSLVEGGRRRALDLLLQLTNVNVDGPHTRRRIPREKAVQVASWGDTKSGELVVRLLSGAEQRALDGASAGAFRLITVEREEDVNATGVIGNAAIDKNENRIATAQNHPIGNRESVNLIHETLIKTRRAERRTQSAAKPEDLPYWPTLWNHIETSKARAPQRARLEMLAKEWSGRSGIRRLLGLSGWSEVSRFRGLASPQSIEQQYLRWSWVRGGVIRLALISIVGLVSESVYWANSHGLPVDSLKTRWSYKLGGNLPLPKLVEIPAGKFMMGSQTEKNEQPVHPVAIAQPFYLAETETTFDQYDAFAKASARNLPDDRGWGRGTQPVVNVDWNDARAYVNWLGAMTGNSCRLPSEAEWEYAARAGTTTEYALPADAKGSDDIKGKALANCEDCGSKWSGKQTAPVGQFPANAWKLHDMHGNVWEWVEDCYHENYEGAPENGDAWQTEGSCRARVLRGGAWFGNAAVARSAARGFNSPDFRNVDLGFRVWCVSPIE